MDESWNGTPEGSAGEPNKSNCTQLLCAKEQIEKQTNENTDIEAQTKTISWHIKVLS